MTYGTSRTGALDEDTIAHIVRDDGRSLCGVKLTMRLSTLAGWNLCDKCETIA